MIFKDDITNLKTDIKENIGQKIIVKGTLGRSKYFEKEATIEKAYPNLFIVKYDENDRNVTYSYTDVLTRTVEVSLFDGESYNPMVPPTVETKKHKNL
ncbi:MAG: Veg protein [Clostridia bacterium]|nr:Veg protein [Clostridia bacterium]